MQCPCAQGIMFFKCITFDRVTRRDSITSADRINELAPVGQSNFTQPLTLDELQPMKGHSAGEQNDKISSHRLTRCAQIDAGHFLCELGEQARVVRESARLEATD